MICYSVKISANTTFEVVRHDDNSYENSVPDFDLYVDELDVVDYTFTFSKAIDLNRIQRYFIKAYDLNDKLLIIEIKESDFEQILQKKEHNWFALSEILLKLFKF